MFYRMLLFGDRLLKHIVTLKSLIFVILITDFIVFSVSDTSGLKTVEEEVYGVKYASDCEVCKLLVTELENRLQDTGKSHDVIETGYTFDREKRTKKKYTISELRLIESMEDICDTLLNYNVHKERTDSTRFSKGMSTTFKTLHGLVDKGVKVDLGIPYELWDKPSAEVTYLKSQCENMIERHESDIENWYFNHQSEQSLLRYLCQDRVLKSENFDCLYEKLIDDQSKREKVPNGSAKTSSKSTKNSEL